MAASKVSSSCKFGDESNSTADTFSVFVCQNGAVFTGHYSRVNVWTRAQDKSKTVCVEWNQSSSLTTPAEGNVNAICSASVDNRELLIISVDKSIACYDMTNLSEPLHFVCHNKDEINQLTVNAKGNILGTCDDSGEIKLINTSSFKVIKTLIAHVNICSTLQFIPRKPWDLVSGGLDCKVIRWDFNRGRPLCVLDQNHLSKSTVGSCSINPPMVHTLDVFPSTSTVVCGLGNGMICAYALRSNRTADLLCVSELHTASISSVCTVEVSKSSPKAIEQFIVSGGNDKKVCVSKLTVMRDQSKAGSSHCLELLSQVNHDSKINCLTLHRNCADLFIFVADLTCYISVYNFVLN